MRNQRKKIWIDRFQTILAARLIAYFVAYQVGLWAMLLIDQRLSSVGGAVGGESTTRFVFAPAAAVLLGVLFIRDAILLTHRIVGPLYRFRTVVKAVTAGDEVALVTLRDGDYLLELRDDLNEMLRALEQRGAVTFKADAKAAEPAAV